VRKELVDRIAAWTAASLAAAWAAVFVPGCLTLGFGFIFGLPLALPAMAIVGLPLALFAQRMGWTGWIASAVAGGVAGAIWMAALLLRQHDHSGGALLWIVLAGFVPGMLGGCAFRATLARYRIIGAQPEALSGYHYVPSPWPATILLVIMTGVALGCWLNIRAGEFA
jgi:hypothetical protein